MRIIGLMKKEAVETIEVEVLILSKLIVVGCTRIAYGRRQDLQRFQLPSVGLAQRASTQPRVVSCHGFFFF